MERLDSRFDIRAAVVAGLAAAVCLMAFEIVAIYLKGPETAGMPLRMVAAVVLGRQALAPDYSFAAAAAAGAGVCIAASVAVAAVFVQMVSWLRRIADGELLTTRLGVAFAGIVFGSALWLVIFYVVAPLAGWTWFPENPHHAIAFLGAVCFGAVLGVAAGRSREPVPRAA